MKNYKYVDHKECAYTPDEAWIDNNRVGAYNASTKWALENVDGDCLIIASPIIEAKEIISKGYKVKYMDIRKPPFEYIDYVYGDATNIPFENESQELISTSCVICHAGMGRYGDPLTTDGDEKMMSELSRVLKVGGKLVITFGPVSDGETGFIVGKTHRIFTMSEAERMASDNNLAVIHKRIWCETGNGFWRNITEKPMQYIYPGNFDYLSMVLVKKS